jgi:hypothetical protein
VIATRSENFVLTSNRFAFKEWAAVCAALESGRQTVIVRKGGIHEEGDGFRVEHREFWLFPTRFHQTADELTEDAAPFLAEALSGQPQAGLIRLRSYAVVERVERIDDERLLPPLAALTILSERTLADRFHYRDPGLFVLAARIYRLPEPLDMPDSPHFAGCRSWVDLPDDVPTTGVTPVMEETAFRSELARLGRMIGRTGLA